jgi:hypothetical protein
VKTNWYSWLKDSRVQIFAIGAALSSAGGLYQIFSTFPIEDKKAFHGRIGKIINGIPDMGSLLAND